MEFPEVWTKPQVPFDVWCDVEGSSREAVFFRENDILLEELKAEPEAIGQSLATLTIIYLVSFFLIVCLGIVTTMCSSGVVGVIFFSVLAIWLLTANIMIAIKLRKLRATIVTITLQLTA